MNNESIKAVVNNRLNTTFTCLPATIVSYDPLTCKAVVEPTLKVRLKNERLFTIPPILNVPVVFPSSSNSVMTFPLTKGDEVMLVFSMKSLDDYLNSDNNRPIKPEDRRTFSLDDAIAIPGLYGFKRTPNNPSKHTLAHSTDDMVVKHNLGSPNENELRLKADGSAELTAGGTKLKINLNGDIEITGGDLILANNDVIAQGISLVNHVHGQPNTGENATVQGNTLGPQ